MSFIPGVQREILEALEELVKEREERGNCQSRHGHEAGISFEISQLSRALDKLMGKSP
jgi:hypothetical protein